MLSIHHFEEGQGFGGNSADNDAFDGVQYVAQFVTRTLILAFAVIAFIVAIAFCKSESPNTTNRAVGKSKPNENRNPVFQSFDSAGAVLSNNGGTK